MWIHMIGFCGDMMVMVLYIRGLIKVVMFTTSSIVETRHSRDVLVDKMVIDVIVKSTILYSVRIVMGSVMGCYLMYNAVIEFAGLSLIAPLQCLDGVVNIICM